MQSGFVDTRRALLRLAGADRVDFLQGLVTSDVTRVAPDRAVYAALLTPQGKFLFDFFLVADGDALLLDTAADRVAALAQRLALYKLRRAVEIAPAEGREVALIWGPGAAPAGGVADPRAAALGWRMVQPTGQGLPSGVAPADAAAYDALRVAHGVPEAGLELVPEESFVLEHGLAELGGVDFRKGCYVGQEVTARMRHKTELKKGLRRVAVTGAAAPGAEIVTAEGKVAGRLGTVAGGEALAHLRLDRASGPLTAGDATLRLIGD